MKKLVPLLLLLATMASHAVAQQVSVVKVKGYVTMKDGTANKAVFKGQTINESAILQLSKGCQLVLRSDKKSEEYTLEGAFIGSLKQYLNKNKNSLAKVVRKYTGYVAKNATAKKKAGSGKDDISTATVIRDDEEAMLDTTACDSIVPDATMAPTQP